MENSPAQASLNEFGWPIVERFPYAGKVVDITRVGLPAHYMASVNGEWFNGGRWYKSVEGAKRAVRLHLREKQQAEMNR